MKKSNIEKSMFLLMFCGLFFIAAISISAQTCQPRANQIAIFESWKFEGKCRVLNVGEYTNPAAMNFGNDSISSIKVGDDVKANLCENDDFTGTCQTFEADKEFLEDSIIGNDSASSIKVILKDDGAVFINRAKVSSCTPEPGWKTCLEMANPTIRIFGSRLASQSALNGVANTYTGITKRLNPKYPKDKFNGYKIYLTNGEPWSELSRINPVGNMWKDQTGPMSGDFLRGGTTENYLWIDEQMICKTGVRTRNEARTPDNEKRTLDQVVHEFGHAIDFKYIPDQTVDANFNRYPDFPAGERFPWAIQNWFGTPDGDLTAKEEAVMKNIFSSRTNLKCEGYQP